MIIREIQEKLSATQDEMAYMLSVSGNTYRKWRNGYSNPNNLNYDKINWIYENIENIRRDNKKLKYFGNEKILKGVRL